MEVDILFAIRVQYNKPAQTGSD